MDESVSENIEEQSEQTVMEDNGEAEPDSADEESEAAGLDEVILHDMESYFRYFRRKINRIIREKFKKGFTNILYLTADCPPYTFKSSKLNSPLEYIDKIKKQYPDNNIAVLIPIIGLDDGFRVNKKLSIEVNGKQKTLEKTSIRFDYFAQSKKRRSPER